MLDEVHRLLSRAYPLDPALGYPWRAWAELIELRDIDDPMSRQVVARAMRESGAGPDIGYRRAPVTISHEGWALEIPGSFAERRTPEEWWGGGAGRAITLAAVQTGDGRPGPWPRRRSSTSSPGTWAPMRSTTGPAAWSAGRGCRATRAPGVEVGILEGYSAVVGSGAAIRIEFDDPADWQWALDIVAVARARAAGAANRRRVPAETGPLRR